MKQNTKTIVIAGAAVAGVYLLSQSMSSEQAGGFGGGGGVPLLPGDVGESPIGDTINYIMGGEPVGDPFGSFGEEEEINETKKVSKPPTLDFPSPTGYVRDINPETGIERTTGTAIRTTPEGTGLFASLASAEFSPESKKSEGKAWYAPWTWNLGDAIKNYGEYSDKTWGRTPQSEETFFGGGKSGGEGFGGSWTDPIKKQNIMKISKKSSEVSKAGSSGRYWRVSGSHSPGWKQIGAKPPTAPGQPDRY